MSGPFRRCLLIGGPSDGEGYALPRNKDRLEITEMHTDSEGMCLATVSPQIAFKTHLYKLLEFVENDTEFTFLVHESRYKDGRPHIMQSLMNAYADI